MNDNMKELNKSIFDALESNAVISNIAKSGGTKLSKATTREGDYLITVDGDTISHKYSPEEFKPLYFGVPLISVNKKEAECIYPRKNTFTLTDKQLDKLQDVLSDHTDCGPMHEGWCSDELNELIEVFSNE